jgi:hypothetical protein
MPGATPAPETPAPARSSRDEVYLDCPTHPYRDGMNLGTSSPQLGDLSALLSLAPLAPALAGGRNTVELNYRAFVYRWASSCQVLKDLPTPQFLTNGWK